MGVFEPYNEEFIDEYVEEEVKSDLPEKLQYNVALYLKVGLFCGWSWQEFHDTPLWVTDEISKEIDRRLKPYLDSMAKSSSGGSSKAIMPLDFNHLSILLALATAFGGGSD